MTPQKDLFGNFMLHQTHLQQIEKIQLSGPSLRRKRKEWSMCPTFGFFRYCLRIGVYLAHLWLLWDPTYSDAWKLLVYHCFQDLVIADRNRESKRLKPLSLTHKSEVLHPKKRFERSPEFLGGLTGDGLAFINPV